VGDLIQQHIVAEVADLVPGGGNRDGCRQGLVRLQKIVRRSLRLQHRLDARPQPGIVTAGIGDVAGTLSGVHDLTSCEEDLLLA
jgi:hypothetical protein